MKKEDIMKSCINMPIAQLLGLLNMKYKEVLDIELKIVNDWIKNKRCKCSENRLVQEKKVSLNCEHLNKEIEKHTKEKEFIIELMSNCLNFRNLMKSDKFRRMFV